MVSELIHSPAASALERESLASKKKDLEARGMDRIERWDGYKEVELWRQGRDSREEVEGRARGHSEEQERG